MHTATTTTKASLRAQLNALAREQRRALCGHCGGSPVRPCTRCARQRARIVELYDADEPLATMAASLTLPVWRVEQILEEELNRDHDDIDDERAANAELLRPELDSLVDVILAGPHPAPGAGWEFDDPRHWHLWVALTLELVGWHIKAVNSVLAGTHIPNAPLRTRVLDAKAAAAAAGGLLTSETLAASAGLTCGTYVDRLLGVRPASTSTRNGRSYGGQLMKAIPIEHAIRIAAALGIPLKEIPGL
jgi:hypothetical protein